MPTSIDDDDNNTMLVEELFAEVVARISSSSSDSDTTSASINVSSDTKLQLYGLFKYCTVGECPAGGSGSWSPTVIAKHRAWQQVSSSGDSDSDSGNNIDRKQAMLQYVTLAADLDIKCEVLLNNFHKKQTTAGEGMESSSSDSGSGVHGKDDTSKPKSMENTDSKNENKNNEKNSKATSPPATVSYQPSTSNVWRILVEMLAWIWNSTVGILLPQVQPVIPRGGLDIQWTDLWFALCACFWSSTLFKSGARRRQLEDEVTATIATLWKDHTIAAEEAQDKSEQHQSQLSEASSSCLDKNNVHNVDVVVGYSVRSLFNLYLMHKQFPPQNSKEVIIVPPITIPGMVQLLEHYGLVVVPVDTMEPTKVDVSDIEAAITERTVAIMIVHPFGTTSASSKDFARLRVLADHHSLELWEDAAESYRGVAESTGSPYADLTFVSFGLIKTATALGGGIAILKDHQQSTSSSSSPVRVVSNQEKNSSTAATDMRRLQQHHYLQQSSYEYFSGKVMQAILIQVFSQNPILYGWLAYLIVQWGGYEAFDRMVTKNVRSIVPPSPASSSKSGKHHATKWMELLRKRPSLPLLQSLHRRLLQSRDTCRSVQRRIQQCQSMTEILKEYAPAVVVQQPTNDQASAYWLYPIFVDPKKKQYVQEYLLQNGWDIAAGSSQLRCVLPSVLSSLSSEQPVINREFMAKVIYLPVSSRSLTRQQCKSLAQGLHWALAAENSDDLSVPGHQRKRLSMSSYLALLSLPLILFSASGHYAPTLFMIRVILPNTLILLGYGFVCMMTGGLFLRWLGGSLYLDSSTAFARYNSMLSNKSSTQMETQPEEGKNSDRNAGVIEAIPSLRLPTTLGLPEGVFRGYVILTGATGFCGSLILRDLLLHRKKLNLSAGVYVICRGKRSKTAAERVKDLLEDDMFLFLSPKEREELVNVLEGDVTQPNAGLSVSDLDCLRSLHKENAVLTHLIHTAAAVSFTQKLGDAARTNIAAALNMQEMTYNLGQVLLHNQKTQSLPKPQFVHISTAFVHGAGSGTESDPLPQSLFPLEPYQPKKLFDSMLGTHFYASKAMSDMRFHNTYAFTKCICEHLLVERSHKDKLGVPTLIIRPSIVGPALENPQEGWAGQKPSTIVAAGCLYLSYQWNLWCFAPADVACIPVDVLSRFVLAKAFAAEGSETAVDASAEEAVVDSSSTGDSFERIPSNDSADSLSTYSSKSQVPEPVFCHGARIYTAAWNPLSSANAMFTWLDYCGATLQFAALFGYFYRSTAYIGLWTTSRLMPRLQMSLETYELVHYIVVQLPVRAFIHWCRLVNWVKLDQTVSKLSSFLDLPLLFFPYMNKKFYFESELAAPETMNGDRYAFSCTVGAHRFVQEIKSRSTGGFNKQSRKSVPPQRPEAFLIGGKQHSQPFNLWWALTQPTGSLLVRIAGWFFAKLLRATCHGLSVDISSFELALKKRLEFASTSEDSTDKRTIPVHLVLTPTHRSFFDFVIISYLAFAIPELHLDIPAIAAADDFARLPLIGLLARCLGAFYLRRGRGVADPELRTKVTSIKQEGAAVFEVFLEGSRSRDRRFLKPKTGFLRSLGKSDGVHIVVPIAISYERLPEQGILAAQVSGQCRKNSLSAIGLVMWLKNAFQGRVNLGRIHVAAGEPTVLKCETSSDYADMADSIQRQQQDMIVYSDYHYEATSKLLGLDLKVVRTAMVQLGCRPWPTDALATDNLPPLVLPEDISELCTISLQVAHKMSKLCYESHKEWAIWMNRIALLDERQSLVCTENPAIKALTKSLVTLLDAAEVQAGNALTKLVSNGFYHPTTSHLLQTASKDTSNITCVPGVLLTAAASMLQTKIAVVGGAERDSNDSGFPLLLKAQSLLTGSEERLGFWGFRDSGFTLEVTKKGSYHLTMRGMRYSLSGKRLSGLLPFVEAETKVQINPSNEAFVTRPHITTTTESLAATSLSDESIHHLQSTVSKLSLSLGDRIRHGTGHSQEDIFAIRSGLDSAFRIPDAVVWPSSEDEVVKVIALAKLHSWCLIPFGGGTNVSNATRCPSYDEEPRSILSVDMTKMNRLLWLNEEDGLACVEAGINGRDLVHTLEQRGYTMGHEPDSYEFSTLGGWVATKASGMKRNKYGNIEDIVRDIRVASSEGLVTEKSGNNPNTKASFGRESCGMDFRSVMLGSEGCLGIVTSAIVKVWPLPEVKEFDSVLLTSLEHGLSFVRDVAKLDRMLPVSVRLLDNEHFRLGQALRADPSSAKEHFMRALQTLFASSTMSTFDSKSVVCTTICYEGSSIEIRQQKTAMNALSKRHGGISLGSKIGASGYDLTFMIAYLRDFAMTYHFLGESFETFAPWSKVASIIKHTKARIQQEHEIRCLPGIPFVGCRVTQLYHDGACLYFYLCMNTENVKDASKVFADIEHAARAEIMQQGGSLSHHHGVGKIRAAFLKESTTPAFQEIVAGVKNSLDPVNVFGAANGLFGTT